MDGKCGAVGGGVERGQSEGWGERRKKNTGWGGQRGRLSGLQSQGSHCEVAAVTAAVMSEHGHTVYVPVHVHMHTHTHINVFNVLLVHPPSANIYELTETKK